MIPNYLIRVEFANRTPFMYSFNGLNLSDAEKSASSFMNLVEQKNPLRAEIWNTKFLELVAIVDHIKRDLEG